MLSSFDRKKFLLELCEQLDCDVTYFIFQKTGLWKPGFKLLMQLRMQELGIYSINDLARQLGCSNHHLRMKINQYDREATEEQKQYAKFREQQESDSGN